MFPGGATVPGRALIETLPLVWQIVLVCVLWHVGRASATGGAITVSAVTAAIARAGLLSAAIPALSFGRATHPCIVGEARVTAL